jgi:hypothetical protein
VADFREVRAVVAQAGRVRPVARLVFAGHVARGRRVVIPLSLIRSRAYGTPVPGQIVADFFQEQCERAGFVVRPARGGRRFGWSATREPSHSASQAASALHGHDYLVTGRIITTDGRSLPVELTVHGAGPLAEGEVRDAALGLLRGEHAQCVWDGEASVKAVDATKHG